ncbi:hypothetical protein [Prevotella sp. oral taxon 376]|uniref:hypothetical protein n=1 Tax=Prevotella sp. oral taxon 376 TaxID=712466 RepID=UPI0011B1D133|nr:hypothetical protein [Prevotella sp. oral taxon 376]
MKRIRINIPIYTWSDFKQWFWDRIAYPRREVCAMWLEMNNSNIKLGIENIIIEELNLDLNNEADVTRLSDICRRFDSLLKEETNKTINLMCKH